jgi:hypothetical protein
VGVLPRNTIPQLTTAIQNGEHITKTRDQVSAIQLAAAIQQISGVKFEARDLDPPPQSVRIEPTDSEALQEKDYANRQIELEQQAIKAIAECEGWKDYSLWLCPLDTEQSYAVLHDGAILRVIAYIPDRHYSSREEAKLMLRLHRYHLFNCDPMRERTGSGGSRTYCITTRNEGNFIYRIHVGKQHKRYNDQPLKLCKVCRALLQSRLGTFVEVPKSSTFATQGWLKRYFSGDLLPKLDPASINPEDYDYDIDTIPNQYVADWPKISLHLKERHHWTCEKCGWRPIKPQHRKYLHGHHVNSKRHDNAPHNLKVLCIRCHANEPYHEHIRKTSSYTDFSKIRL